MSFDWADYLTLAEALERDPATPGPEEAAQRAAISRAYYAVFCRARNFARDREGLILTGEAQDHGLVVAHFRSSTDKTRRKIASDLGRLRTNRNKADYDDVLAGRQRSLAQLSVTTARTLLTALASL